MLNKLKERIKKLAKPFQKWFPPVRLGVILLAIIVVMLLFIPPINGTVDDGSYNLILHANGLREYANDPDYFKYFVPKFPILQYYNPDVHVYLSLQNIIIQIAILLNKIFYSTHVFDIRFLGALYAILYLLAARLLFKGLSNRLKGYKAYLIVLLGVFMLGDTTYTIYFNSFYIEPLDMIMIMFFVGFGLLAFQQTEDRKILKYYSGQLLIAFLFMFVSREMSLLLSALCISLIGGIIFIRKRQWKLSAIILVSSLVPMSLFIGTLYSNPARSENLYQSATLGAMPASKNPGKDLAIIDVDPQSEVLRGTSYSEPYAIASSDSKTIQKGFIEELSYPKLVWYYFTHPKVLSNLMQMGLENKNVARAKNVSTYEKGAVSEKDQNKVFFQWATLLKGAFLPKKFGFYFLFSILVISIYGIACVRGWQMGSKLYAARFFVIVGLLIMMFLAFMAPIIISGETSVMRQLTLTSVILDILVLRVISDSLQHDIWITKDTVLVTKMDRGKE